MWLSSLRIEDLRCLQSASLQPHRRLNVLVGANGAGKSSVLEAVHCLGSGRSFRSGQTEHLIRRGALRYQVVAELADDSGEVSRIGFERDRDGWRARVDGNEVATLGDLARRLAVLCFEPQSHELVAGPAEGRRRLLDLALFHVEPDYLQTWRRYQRALRQRNAALRQYSASPPWAAWEGILAESGQQLATIRRGWCERLEPQFQAALTAFLPGFEARFRWRAGWDENEALAEVLALGRDRDRDLGYTVSGPHRCDLRLDLGQGQGRHEMSRGQQKLVALALLLATAAAMRMALGWSPLVLLDDLPSELDRDHQSRCLGFLLGLQAQLWITGTQLPQGLERAEGDLQRYRVDAGRVELEA